jgi:hypothetical protein
MNKDDINLIITIGLISLLILIAIFFTYEDGSKNAKVYYKNNLVLTIDLEKEESKEYYVNGKNGKITIFHQNGKIKVLEENSPLHICSKQGFISESYETIVCLPNEVIIKIVTKNDLDTVIE